MDEQGFVMSALRFDVDREIAKSISAQCVTISMKAQWAVDRLYWMHAVGSGICGCGSDMQDHPLWDNHSPVEMPIDKSAWGVPTECSDCAGRGANDYVYDDPFRGPGQTLWETCETCKGTGIVNPERKQQ